MADAKPPIDYRPYIDESGDHTSCADGASPIGKRYLGLIGGVAAWSGCGPVPGRARRPEEGHLPYDCDDPLILHREEIVNKRGAFRVFQEAEKREKFDADLLALLKSTNFMAIAVVCDKLTHGRARYRRLSHPYHYCLLAMLERYCGWLKFMGLRGDVMVESRGGVEDREFERAYEDLYDNGSGPAGYLPKDRAQATLTSRHPKLKKKGLNIAGLQLADLLAHPLTRDVLVAYGRLGDRGGAFADQIAEVIAWKYNRQVHSSAVKGYGQVFLP